MELHLDAMKTLKNAYMAFNRPFAADDIQHIADIPVTFQVTTQVVPMHQRLMTLSTLSFHLLAYEPKQYINMYIYIQPLGLNCSTIIHH